MITITRFVVYVKTNEPAHDKTYNKSCDNSKCSDHSLYINPAWQGFSIPLWIAWKL